MSKAGRPRPRYIACRIETTRAPSRKAFQAALIGESRKAGLGEEMLPKLTRFDGRHAIVWADHRAARAVRAILGHMDRCIQDGARLPMRVVTLATSGTIKGLSDRTGILAHRGPTNDAPSSPRTGPRTGPRRGPGTPGLKRATQRPGMPKPQPVGGDPRRA